MKSKEIKLPETVKIVITSTDKVKIYEDKDKNSDAIQFMKGCIQGLEDGYNVVKCDKEKKRILAQLKRYCKELIDYEIKEFDYDLK